MKPGTAVKPKTKFSAKYLIVGTVLLVWLISILACSRTVHTTDSTSATALSELLTAVASTTPQAASSQQPSPQPNAEPTSTAHTLTATSESVLHPSPTLDPPMQSSETPSPEPTASAEAAPAVILYTTQAGDTLKSLAVRYNVQPGEITSPNPIPQEGLFSPDQLLVIPNRVGVTGPDGKLLPDSEVVFSPSAINFDINDYVNKAGGYLSTYTEQMKSGPLSGADIVKRVAIENSINPRLLLALLEYKSHWVTGQPANLAQTDYPMGHNEFGSKGLYYQLSWAVQQLSIGYYGWRAGLLTQLDFPAELGGETVRLAPNLNAGTVALQYLFSRMYAPRDWAGALYSTESLNATFTKMFDDPFARAVSVEPLYPPNLTQPSLELPFGVGRTWSMTGGPHSAWGPDGALAALDFAPGSTEHGCAESLEWVRASASGLVVRSDNGVVMVDLDGDGYEQTGWALLYLHIAKDGRVPAGTWVQTGDPLGHPSCEGGLATGTHTHIARKYNGEWILADGPIPFVLSGWQAHAGPKPYIGSLTKGDQTVDASMVGSFESRITH